MDTSILLMLFAFFGSIYGMHNLFFTVIYPKPLKLKKDYNHTPTVTVMISAFNESKDVYDTVKSIYDSDYPIENLHVIVADDCSLDDTFIWMQKAAEDYPGVKVFKNSVNMGKAPTMYEIAKLADTEYLICTDADTVFDKQAVREIMAGFTSPDIGAVGGQIGIRNPNENILTQMQTYFYATSFALYKSLDNLRGTTQCQGGPIVGFTKEIYLKVVPEVLSRNFLGTELLLGEDRYITQCLLLEGLKTYTNLDAKCWVGTPVTWDVYLKQQLRWSRSATGQMFGTLVNLRRYIDKAGIYVTIGSLMPIFSTIAWLLMFWVAVDCGMLLSFLGTVIVLKIIVGPVFSIIYNILIVHMDPTQRINNPVITSWYTLVWFIVKVVWITPFALATLDQGGWVTRSEGSGGNA